jgi:hypothetical protein
MAAQAEKPGIARSRGQPVDDGEVSSEGARDTWENPAWEA